MSPRMMGPGREVMRGGMMGGMGMGRAGRMGMMMDDDRPRSAPAMGMGGYPGLVSPRMGGGMGGMGGRGGPPGTSGGLGGMGPPGMGGLGGPGMGSMGPPGPMMCGPPDGMMGGPGGMMGGPGGMMGGPSGGMGGMNELPPRYSSGHPPGHDPYAYPAPPPSSAASRSERPPHRRSPGRNERIPMGAFAKGTSPKMSRRHTSPTATDRIHRKTGGSGKEWIKGDDFLDGCMCTTNCTCREGHRVLYRSRDAPYDDPDGEVRYGQGEIRYILKRDIGKDCGDHSNCKKKDDSDNEVKASKKEKKKEEKKRKEEFQGFKEDMLEALDERFDALKKAKSSKAGSVSSPRPPFAEMGTPFGMSADPNAMSPNMSTMMGLPMNMPGSNPYAMAMPGNAMGGMPGISKMPQAGMSGAPMQMRSGQMPMRGMTFEDEISMADVEGVGVGNPYLGAGRGMRPRFTSPSGRRDPRGLDMDIMEEFYRRGGLGRGRGGPRARGLMRAPQRRGHFGSDDSFPGPRQKAREDSSDNIGGKFSIIFKPSACKTLAELS
jgi:hypothetical protein